MQSVRYAYALADGSRGMVFVKTDQWVGDAPKRNNFDMVDEHQTDVLIIGGRKFEYVGAFTGDFYHVADQLANDEYERILREKYPALF